MQEGMLGFLVLCQIFFIDNGNDTMLISMHSLEVSLMCSPFETPADKILALTAKPVLNPTRIRRKSNLRSTKTGKIKA